MRRIRLVLAVVLAVAACDPASAPAGDGSSPPQTTTTVTTVAVTVDPEQACREVADELATLLGDVLDELDELDAATFSDRSRWPVDLLRLEAAGVELDRAAADLGCDPGALQAEAFAAVAEREPRSLLSRWLLELLLGGGSPDL